MFLQFNKATDADDPSAREVKLVDYSKGCLQPLDLPLRYRALWATARYMDLHGMAPDGEERFGRRVGTFGPHSSAPPMPERQMPRIRFKGANIGDYVGTNSTVVKNGAVSGEALVVDAVAEKIRVGCGRCRVCTNLRKARWERAATGWIENTDLTLFGTLTFSEEYFAAHWNSRPGREGLTADEALALVAENVGHLEGADEYLAGCREYLDRFPVGTLFRDGGRQHGPLGRADAPVTRFDPDDAAHHAFMRQLLSSERVKMTKRLRHHLAKDPRFEGVKLVAHLNVFEVGDNKGRLHMHFLAHFSVGDVPVDSAVSMLREFYETHWHELGIGFVNVKHATPEGGVGAAKYLLQYLMKYQDTPAGKTVEPSRARLAVSLQYRRQGTRYYVADRPDLFPDALEEGDPMTWPSGRIMGTGSPSDRDPDLSLSPQSQEAFDSLPDQLQKSVADIARARMAFITGELWAGWSSGLNRPEVEWAEIPDDEWTFAAWLIAYLSHGLSRFGQLPDEPCPEPVSSGPPGRFVPWGDGWIDERTGEVVDDPPFE